MSEAFKTDTSFKDFHARIMRGYEKGVDDSAWRTEVGYRPEDKDSGFKRWLELTNNKMDDYLVEFRTVVYGDSAKDTGFKEMKQRNLFST